MGLLTSLAKCADCVNSKLILLSLVFVQLTVGSEGLRPPAETYLGTELRTRHHKARLNHTLRSVVTVSHADALYKSFKLTVSVNDVAKTLDADFWPEGIMVRRYRTQSSKWRESLTN